MELKLTNESICVNEVVFDGVLEQSIELDYLLPDYCQSIFKVLKCKVVPKITSQRIMNGKMLIDGIAYIKVIYVSEECYHIRSIMQKQVFSKSMDLKEPYENGMVSAYCKCDYVNCRVVNQHRLDIRGAVSIKVTITCPKKLEIISKASGMGVQVDNEKITVLGKKLCTCKEFSIKEELELAYGKPSITEILDYNATAAVIDYKLIPNKVVLKGEIMLHILYCGEEEAKPEIMEHTIPISQIVDMQGITDDYLCMFDFDITSVDICLKSDGDGECKCYEVEFVVRANLEANKNDEAQLINDIYSTGYELKASLNKVKIEQLVCVIKETSMCKNSVKIPQNEVSCVYDIVCEFCNECGKYSDGCLIVTGNLNVSILALNCENMPMMIEKSTPCEMKIDCKCCDGDVSFNPNVMISSISYTMIGSDEIELRVELLICGNLYRSCYYNIVNKIDVDENCKKAASDAAVVRIYFASAGEKIWDIAKRYNTSISAILTENELSKDALDNDSMLLIPLIN